MADTSPSGAFLKRFLGISKGKSGDIDLPNESGKTDKRLKKKNKLQQMQEGYGIFKNMGKKNASE